MTTHLSSDDRRAYMNGALTVSLLLFGSAVLLWLLSLAVDPQGAGTTIWTGIVDSARYAVLPGTSRTRPIESVIVYLGTAEGPRVVRLPWRAQIPISDLPPGAHVRAWGDPDPDRRGGSVTGLQRDGQWLLVDPSVDGGLLERKYLTLRWAQRLGMAGMPLLLCAYILHRRTQSAAA